RSAHADLDVVPGRVIAVARVVERRGLRVAPMPVVVVAPAREVDAARERDVLVAVGPARPLDDDDLLVVAAAPPDAVIEHGVAAGVVHGACQLDVVDLSRVRADGMRPPEQRQHVDTPSREIGEDGSHRGVALAAEPLVGVALEVAQQHAVARPAGDEGVEEAREVPGAVDEHVDLVALRPGPAAVRAARAARAVRAAAPADRGGGVGALRRGQEPGVELHPQLRAPSRAVPTSGEASRSGSEPSTFSSSCGSASPARTASSWAARAPPYSSAHADRNAQSCNATMPASGP